MFGSHRGDLGFLGYGPKTWSTRDRVRARSDRYDGAAPIRERERECNSSQDSKLNSDRIRQPI